MQTPWLLGQPGVRPGLCKGRLRGSLTRLCRKSSVVLFTVLAFKKKKKERGMGEGLKSRWWKCSSWSVTELSPGSNRALAGDAALQLHPLCRAGVAAMDMSHPHQLDKAAPAAPGCCWARFTRPCAPKTTSFGEHQGACQRHAAGAGMRTLRQAPPADLASGTAAMPHSSPVSSEKIWVVPHLFLL